MSRPLTRSSSSRSGSSSTRKLPRELADNHHVDIRTYEVIYKLIEELRDALAGLLSPELVEQYEGTAAIRQVFRVSKVGKIAGCMVTDGVMRRNSKARLLRDGVVA